MFFTLEQQDFWRMIFYRALFEEQNYHIAKKVLPFLDEDFSKIITDLEVLYTETEHLHKEIYSFDDQNDIPDSFHIDFAIKQLILRIDYNGMISYRMNSTSNEVIDGRIFDECWNVNFHGTPFYTAGIGALQASLCLCHSLFRSITQCYFVKVMNAVFRFLFWHRNALPFLFFLCLRHACSLRIFCMCT